MNAKNRRAELAVGTPRSAAVPLPALYTVAEVASYAKTSQKTVRRWLEAGLLPSHRFGRQIRIIQDDLLAFLAEQRHG